MHEMISFSRRTPWTRSKPGATYELRFWSEPIAESSSGPPQDPDRHSLYEFRGVYFLFIRDSEGGYLLGPMTGDDVETEYPALWRARKTAEVQ